MNRYPSWAYAAIALVVVLAFLYTLPNFFGESPAVQVSSVKTTVTVDTALLGRVEDTLKKSGIPYTQTLLDPNSVRVRFTDTDTQLKAKDLIDKTLNPDSANATYVVALDLLSASPAWLTSIRALPMYLGLDLRGGVHFLLQVDMQAALTKRIEGLGGDIRSNLRDKNVRPAGITRAGQVLRIRFREAPARTRAREVIGNITTDLALVDRDDGQDLMLVATLKPEAQKSIQEAAVKQNIVTLNKRVNELGVAEPVIQQQGENRIVVQLPGVQEG